MLAAEHRWPTGGLAAALDPHELNLWTYVDLQRRSGPFSVAVGDRHGNVENSSQIIGDARGKRPIDYLRKLCGATVTPIDDSLMGIQRSLVRDQRDHIRFSAERDNLQRITYEGDFRNRIHDLDRMRSSRDEYRLRLRRAPQSYK